MQQDITYIFTDGACRGNPGPGGWGALIRSQTYEKEIKGSCAQTTNNRMELTAAIEALASLPSRTHVHLTTDSEYVRKGITEWLPRWQARQWRTASNKPVKNKDLWEALSQQAACHEVRWFWIKGHSGHLENERVDQLANEAIDSLLQQR